MNESKLVDEDHTCAICLTAYYYPIEISLCKHRFCRLCLQDSQTLSGIRKCPLCRQAYTAQQIVKAQELWQQVQKRYPQLVQDKSKTIKSRKLVNLCIGNTTRELKNEQNNKYQWEVFVKTAEGQQPLKQLASKVQIELHPTFHPNKLIYDLDDVDKVQLKRIGWGQFRIYIRVYWKKDYQESCTEFFHDLHFEPIVQNNRTCFLHRIAN